jgi:hypothetical protein
MTTIMIILMPEHAAAVRGPTAPFAALYPVPLFSGEYVLPLGVLDDPNHAMHHELLSSLPTREVSLLEYARGD